MPVRRGALCHRCGSTEFEEIDDSHRRCAECGHGSTFTRMVVEADPSPAQRAAAEDRLRSADAETVRAFGGASFFPYGLDERWRGLRWFGGHGGSGEIATGLSLAFGDSPWNEPSPMIRVTTELAEQPRMSAFLMTRQQVEHLWRETGVLRDEIRRAAFPIDGHRDHDPTVQWDRAPITVDGQAVEFAVLSEHGHWVAQAIIDPVLVGIEARAWSIDAVGLRSETTFDVYAEGLAQLRRLRRP